MWSSSLVEEDCQGAPFHDAQASWSCSHRSVSSAFPDAYESSRFKVAADTPQSFRAGRSKRVASPPPIAGPGMDAFCTGDLSLPHSLTSLSLCSSTPAGKLAAIKDQKASPAGKPEQALMFEYLYNKLRRALSESGQLSTTSCNASVAIVRRVLGEIAQERACGFGLFSLPEAPISRRNVGSIFLPAEVKDLWGLSSLSTLLAYENNSGRHCRVFPSGSILGLDEDRSPQSTAGLLRSPLSRAEREQLEDTLGSHPRSFVSYAFVVTMSGIKYLESEARALWGDHIAAPVSGNRRYSEFLELHHQLSKQYKYRIGTSTRVRLIVVPPLPKKSPVFTFSTDSCFVNKRRRALEIWLRYVSLHRIMSISAPMRRFLLEPAGSQDDFDSFSVGSSASDNMFGSGRSAFESASQSFGSGLSTCSRNLFREDPLVARRARQQVDEMLCKYGSGPVALSTVDTVCPALISGMQSCLQATRGLIKREDGAEPAVQELSKVLLKLAHFEQTSANSSSKHIRFEPLTGLAVALSTLRQDELAARGEVVEAQLLLQQTLRIWSKHVLPKLKSHVANLYNPDVSVRQAEKEQSQAGATPSERLAAEWVEASQVRACMMAKSVEDLAQAQIVQARKRRTKWEQLKAKLERFDPDEFIRELASPLKTARNVAFDCQPSFDQILEQTDRSGAETQDDFERRDAEILAQDQGAQQGGAKRAPPPIPSLEPELPMVPRRQHSQPAINVGRRPVMSRSSSAALAVQPSNERAAAPPPPPPPLAETSRPSAFLADIAAGGFKLERSSSPPPPPPCPTLDRQEKRGNQENVQHNGNSVPHLRSANKQQKAEKPATLSFLQDISSNTFKLTPPKAATPTKTNQAGSPFLQDITSGKFNLSPPKAADAPIEKPPLGNQAPFLKAIVDGKFNLTAATVRNDTAPNRADEGMFSELQKRLERHRSHIIGESESELSEDEWEKNE